MPHLVAFCLAAFESCSVALLDREKRVLTLPESISAAKTLS